MRRITARSRLQANGVFALLPANIVDDDTIEVYADESREQVLLRWSPLRMQTERPVVDGVRRPNRCLADFIAPKTGYAPGRASGAGKERAVGGEAPSGPIADYIGLFAVTAGLGVDKKERQFIADHDDYSAILLKALADRLAEAFAERLHQRVRTEFWGYAPDEALSNEALIAEQYPGIRPAPGYPACPDHWVKAEMFDVLKAGEIGMGLTESLAMTPAASVSGFYLAHPQAAYFNVGRIGDDQIADWAKRMAMEETEARRGSAAALQRTPSHIGMTPPGVSTLGDLGDAVRSSTAPRPRRVERPPAATRRLTTRGSGVTKASAGPSR